MRKLIWIAMLSLSASIVWSSSGGCNAAVDCHNACEDYNALHCLSTCDCNACNIAPAACDTYFNCIRTYSGSCIQLAIACPIPIECQPFINENCH
jgi:hypothetical protein